MMPLALLYYSWANEVMIFKCKIYIMHWNSACHIEFFANVKLKTLNLQPCVINMNPLTGYVNTKTGNITINLLKTYYIMSLEQTNKILFYWNNDCYSPISEIITASTSVTHVRPWADIRADINMVARGRQVWQQPCSRIKILKWPLFYL